MLDFGCGALTQLGKGYCRAMKTEVAISTAISVGAEGTGRYRTHPAARREARAKLAEG